MVKTNNMSKKAKKMKAPMMQKTKKFGKATQPPVPSTGYKGAAVLAKAKSKTKGKKKFNAGAFAKVKKSVFKM